MGDISKNFSLKEFNISSDHPGLLETNAKEMEKFKGSGTLLILGILQPLRETLGVAMTITSGFRGETLNKAVKGSRYSQHMRFEAADFNVKGFRSHEGRLLVLGHIWGLQRAGTIEFGQALIERGCIHISLPRDASRDNEVAYFDVSTKEKRVIIKGGN